MTQDSFYMQRAIALARRGTGFVNPNPLVGAVIVKDGRIIGEGWHAKYGDLHAERNALKNCTEDPKGATMYVTLEPCCHHGKQPPCTEAVLASGIRKLYIGSRDPNPLVSGKGAAFLRSHGVQVIPDFLREECDKLNPIFFHYITTRLPYTIVKYAMTADGKIACYTGASKWVTGEAARQNVQETRKRVAAICVGIGTVLADDPLLTCRTEMPSNPVRVVLDTHLRLPLTAKLVQTAKEVPVIVFTHAPDEEKKYALEQKGVTVLEADTEAGLISIRDVLEQLGKQGLDSVLFEGGSQVLKSVLQSGFGDLVQVYLAPKLFGGDGLSPIAAMQIATPDNAILLTPPEITTLGEDVLLTYRRKGGETPCLPES